MLIRMTLIRSALVTAAAAIALSQGGAVASIAYAGPQDDAYLREIQAEGARLRPLNEIHEDIRRSEERERQALGSQEAARPVANLGEFEKLLQQDSPATYAYYAGLRQEQKKVVYELYREQLKLSAAKRKIVLLHLGI
jgi:hypothetical protein